VDSSIDENAITAADQYGTALQKVANACAQLAVGGPSPGDGLCAMHCYRDVSVGGAAGGAVERLEYGSVKSTRTARRGRAFPGANGFPLQFPDEALGRGDSPARVGISVNRNGDSILGLEALGDTDLPGVPAHRRSEIGSFTIMDCTGRPPVDTEIVEFESVAGGGRPNDT